MLQRVIIHVSQAAMLQITLATIAAYEVPRKVKRQIHPGHETYGLLFGHVVTASSGVTAYSVEHAAIDVYAKRHRDWVDRSLRYHQTVSQVVQEHFPWIGRVGDFHSHLYSKSDHLPRVTGLSNSDRMDIEKNSPREDRGGQKRRVFLVCSIHEQAWKQRPARINQLKWSLGPYRLVLDAYFSTEGRRPGQNHVFPRHRGWPEPYVASSSMPRVSLTAGGPLVS